MTTTTDPYVDKATRGDLARLADYALGMTTAAPELEKAAYRVREFLSRPPAGQEGEPVLWQWRRKVDPWTWEMTFPYEVFATTDDSEVRMLYANPPGHSPDAGNMVAEPVAWIDNSGHPLHLSYLQGVRERELYGPLRPLYASPPAPSKDVLLLAIEALEAAVDEGGTDAFFAATDEKIAAAIAALKAELERPNV